MRRIHLLLGAGLLLFTGSVASTALTSRLEQRTLLSRVAHEAQGEDVAGVRLSIVSGFLACPDSALLPTCGMEPRRPSARLIAVMRQAARTIETAADPDALHAAAVTHLLYPDTSGKSLQRSISFLQSASRMSERTAPVLGDLAAAHLLRARLNQKPRDLLEALEAAERALDSEPEYAPARFNAAEALDRLGLRRQASREWARYLTIDSTSAWAAEARRRLRRLAAPVPQAREPAHSASPATMGKYAETAPRAAREMAFDELLGEWGAAVLGGDTAMALRRLDQTAAIAASLAARGGDASLADNVGEIRRTLRDPPATRHRAALHRSFAEARRAYERTEYDRACPEFNRVARHGSPATLREWARTYAATCLYYQKRSTDARRTLESLATRTDSIRYPALAGRRWWALGAVLLSMGRYEETLQPLERAYSLMERAGEVEHVAGILSHRAQARLQLGDGDAGYEAMGRAVTILERFPASLGLHNALYALGNAAAADGLTEAALRVRDESVAVAEQMGRPQYLAEARLARARLYLEAGRNDIAADVREATRIMNGLDVEFARTWLAADLRETTAVATTAMRPAQSAAELDSVAAFFARQDFPLRLVPALLASANAKLAMRRSAQAAADLRRAMQVLDTLRAHVTGAQLRAALLERSRRVFDRAVMLSISEGRPDEALDFVERSRASFSPVGHAADWAQRPVQVPHAHVAVEFALVGDTLLAWIVDRGGSTLVRTVVSRARLVHDVEQVRVALERRAPTEAVQPVLERLYDQLLRPVLSGLGASGTPLTIVADGELSAVPMAALRDRTNGRYLIEDHAIRFASSLRDPVARPVPPSAGTPATLVANPAFDRQAFPQLQPLPGASAEVAAIARLYLGAEVLSGPEAGLDSLRAIFRRGGITHFAGHAVFDDARPERSFLVVAPTGGQESSRLTAAEIERMNLGRLRLVVLSACQTSRAQAGRSGGFAGLAGAFLAAGAGGVVGSLWQVDDGDTRALMEAFHDEYRHTGNAAEALRQAQLRMLRSEDAELRSPAAWAGFRYAGR